MKNFIWAGRRDGNSPEYARVHQHITVLNTLDNIDLGSIILHGFSVDEGVSRNNGRAGAAEGPDAIRMAMSNLPIHHPKVLLYDAGNITCSNHDLESAQRNLSEKTFHILNHGAKSLVLGGGHELLYPHQIGIRNAYPNKNIGIIYIDAHFDNRKPDPIATSGTGFYQLHTEGNLNALAIGIQKNANTAKLFQDANSMGIDYILAQEFTPYNSKLNLEKIQDFIAGVDILHVSVCMDVFSAAFAPGVSAPTAFGLLPDAYFQHIFDQIISNPKCIALDFAEVNPLLDIDNRTAKLAAGLAHLWLKT